MFGSRLPCMTVVESAFLTVTVAFVNFTVNPPSHNTGTESKGFCMFGKTVAVRRDGCMLGKCNSFVPTELMSVLLAQRAWMGRCGSMLPGHVAGMKCPVAAVSGNAVVGVFCVRGPTVMLLVQC